MTGDREPRSLESDLEAWGRVITLETRGRRTGNARRSSVGFIEEPDGSLLIAAPSSRSRTGGTAITGSLPFTSIVLWGRRTRAQEATDS